MNEDDFAHGEFIAQSDPPDYPAEWNAEQCASAYWYAHGISAQPRSTHAWYAVLAQAHDDAARRRDRLRAKP